MSFISKFETIVFVVDKIVAFLRLFNARAKHGI